MEVTRQCQRFGEQTVGGLQDPRERATQEPLCDRFSCGRLQGSRIPLAQVLSDSPARQIPVRWAGRVVGLILVPPPRPVCDGSLWTRLLGRDAA